MPARTASSTTYWMAGLSTTGSISLGWALVAGRNRVPSPAAGITALRTMRGPPYRESHTESPHGRCAGRACCGGDSLSTRPCRLLTTIRETSCRPTSTAARAAARELEVVQSFDEPSLTVCPHCSGPLRKVFGSIGITFKGDGFYKTDSRSSGKKAASSASSSSSSNGDSGSSGNGDHSHSHGDHSHTHSSSSDSVVVLVLFFFVDSFVFVVGLEQLQRVSRGRRRGRSLRRLGLLLLSRRRRDGHARHPARRAVRPGDDRVGRRSSGGVPPPARAPARATAAPHPLQGQRVGDARAGCALDRRALRGGLPARAHPSRRARRRRPARRPHVGSRRHVLRRSRRAARRLRRPLRRRSASDAGRGGTRSRTRRARRRNDGRRAGPAVLDPRRVAMVRLERLGGHQHDRLPRSGARRRARASRTRPSR